LAENPSQQRTKSTKNKANKEQNAQGDQAAENVRAIFSMPAAGHDVETMSSTTKARMSGCARSRCASGKQLKHDEEPVQ
jgi:hypothetical protein